MQKSLERLPDHASSERWSEGLLSLLRSSKVWLDDIAPAVREFNNPSKRFKLIIPEDALKGLADSSMHTVRARDGSGLLPVFQDEEGHFVRQVRLEDLGESAQALGLARDLLTSLATQATLREISEKLNRIESKLDILLGYQEAEQIGLVQSAMQRFFDLQHDPGLPEHRVPALAAIERDLSVALHIGIEQLRTDVDTLKIPRTRWWHLLAGWSPATEHASDLDRVMRKVEICYVAAKTLAEVDLALERPRAAARRVAEFARAMQDVTNKARPIYDYARFSEDRESFWNREIPALVAAKDPGVRQVVLEATAEQLLGNEMPAFQRAH